MSLLLFSCSVVSDSLGPHGLQHGRLPCPSLSPGVCSDSCPLSWWCHPTISSSVAPFSSCPQSFPASGSGSLTKSWHFLHYKDNMLCYLQSQPGVEGNKTLSDLPSCLFLSLATFLGPRTLGEVWWFLAPSAGTPSGCGTQWWSTWGGARTQKAPRRELGECGLAGVLAGVP